MNNFNRNTLIFILLFKPEAAKLHMNDMEKCVAIKKKSIFHSFLHSIFIEGRILSDRGAEFEPQSLLLRTIMW